MSSALCCRLREAAEAEAVARRLAEEEAERIRKEEEAQQREAARLEALRLEQEARLKVLVLLSASMGWVPGALHPFLLRVKGCSPHDPQTICLALLHGRA